MTRLYLPATMHRLAKLHQQGSLPVDDDVVLAPDDSEDAEYDALMTAAETSLVLANELDPGEWRRVVIVVEVSTLPDSVSLADVVAVHADADDVRPPVDNDDLEDLGWYAVQEIPHLLDLGG